VIFQPAILAFLFASGVCALILAAAAPYAWEIAHRWDIQSGAESQLRLERRTYLLSTLLAFVLVSELLALLLFVFNADRMAPMFVGAMCAVGTLNADAYGFPALYAQIALFFLAAVWLAINHADAHARDYPLTRVKYRLLLGLLPCALLAFGLELAYFLHLRADVITSCCGSLFSNESATLGGDLAALPPAPALALFFGALLAAAGSAFFYAVSGRGAGFVAAAAAVAFVAALAGIVSAISLYVYEHPHHHCPFCLLKPEYGYQGYALYLPLFSATAAGLCVGALQAFAGVKSLGAILPRLQERLAWGAALGFLLTALVAAVMVATSRLTLFG
jgi:hypothetical protein